MTDGLMKIVISQTEIFNICMKNIFFLFPKYNTC